MLKTITKSQTLFERRKNAVADGVGFFNTATVKLAKKHQLHCEEVW